MDTLKGELFKALNPVKSKLPDKTPGLYKDLFEAADGFLKKNSRISILRSAVKAIKNN